MDKKLRQLLLELNLIEIEIEDLKNIAPMIETISYEDFTSNCKLLMDFGYPMEDLDSLILANPNIFVRSEKDLKSDLVTLKNRYGDIEESIKNDPFII